MLLHLLQNPIKQEFKLKSIFKFDMVFLKIL
jgi:hypothetical protein